MTRSVKSTFQFSYHLCGWGAVVLAILFFATSVRADAEFGVSKQGDVLKVTSPEGTFSAAMPDWMRQASIDDFQVSAPGLKMMSATIQLGRSEKAFLRDFVTMFATWDGSAWMAGVVEARAQQKYGELCEPDQLLVSTFGKWPDAGPEAILLICGRAKEAKLGVPIGYVIVDIGWQFSSGVGVTTLGSEFPEFDVHQPDVWPVSKTSLQGFIDDVRIQNDFFVHRKVEITK